MNRRELIAGTAALPLIAMHSPSSAADQDDVYWRAQALINELEEHRAQYDLHETGEDILDLLLDIRR